MNKIQKTVLNRVEGEIEFKLIWEDGKIKDAFVIAPNFRGFEFILEGKSPLDTLVITPRVYGICGHTHLIATTNVLFDINKVKEVEAFSFLENGKPNFSNDRYSWAKGKKNK